MLYDGLLIVAILMVATYLIVVPLGAEVDTGNLLFQMYLLSAWFLYFGVCWRKGQTLGMKAWRIHLVSAHQPPGWGALLVRFLVAGPALAVAGLGYLHCLFDTQRRGWPDLASGTRLVVVPRGQQPDNHF